jgi:hypothetical protein
METNQKTPIQEPSRFIKSLLTVMVVVLFFMMLTLNAGCRVFTPRSAMNIPSEPTIWVVSEIKIIEYEWSEGFVFYKMIPVNPGQLNMGTIWIMDYSGAFQVGERTRFELIPVDQNPD